MRFLIAAVAGVLAFAPAAWAETLIWKTETKVAKEIAPSDECAPDDGECLQADHVKHEAVSHYGRSYYVTYEEAVRAYVSFDGPLDSNRPAQTVFATDQIREGAFDWGGIMVEGQFKPLYVIKRFYDPGYDWSGHVDQGKSGLFVWRLSAAPGNGQSEMIGMAGAGNDAARAFAEKHFAATQQLKE
jgi:hypothetical protein